MNRQTNVCTRVNIPTNNRNIKQNNNKYSKCDIYNTKGETRKLSDIKRDTEILPLVEINDIHITSTSINLYLNMIECMILNDEPSKTFVNRRIKLEENLSEEENKYDNEDNNQSIDNSNDHNNNNNNNEDENKIINNTNELKSSIKSETEIEDNEITQMNNIIKDFEVESQQDNEEIKEDNQEIKEDNEEIKEDNQEIKEDNQEIKEDNQEIKEDNQEIKEDNNDYDPELTNNLEEVNINLHEDENKNEDEDETEDELVEIDTLDINEDDEKISIKKADQVYTEMYKDVISKTKKLRTAALYAYLEAKNIKAKYNLKDIYNSDDDGDEDEDDAEYDELKKFKLNN